MKKVVFLTGGTGFIGKYLIEKLVALPEIKLIYVLRREQSGNPSFNDSEMRKVEFITGDIAIKGLGLSFEDYDKICQEVDVIYHLAAEVNFVKPFSSLVNSNVNSLSELIAICKYGKKKILNFTSTLGAACSKDKNNNYIEDFPDKTPYYSDMGYLQSKYEAEKLLSEEDNRRDFVNIFRLGYITSHSKTGSCPYKNNQLMLFIKSCIQLGVYPNLKRLLNLTSVDFAADIMGLRDFMSSGGHVINLFNCSEYISWNELMSWFVKRGYDMKMTDFKSWQEQFLSAGKDNALFRLRLVYRKKNADDKILRFGKEIDKYRTDKLCYYVDKYGINMPAIKERLLPAMFNYLRSANFLPTSNKELAE